MNKLILLLAACILVVRAESNFIFPVMREEEDGSDYVNSLKSDSDDSSIAKTMRLLEIQRKKCKCEGYAYKQVKLAYTRYL